MEATVRHEAELERVTLQKVTWRLIPFLFALYAVNFIDRTNINSVVLTMKPDLGLGERAVGLAAGIFFVGYFFFQIPSNIMLERVGARRWMSLLAVCWGIVAACMMFIHDTTSLYASRLLLGVAQAGFFPGIMLYLTYWFPNAIRGRAAARFVVANVFAGIVNGPLASTLMQLGGVGGLRGWQWVFLLEGIPAVLLGLAALVCLTDRPEDAHWLRSDEREWLVRRLQRERELRQQHHQMTLPEALRYPRVLHLAAVFFLNIVAGAGVGTFSNLILKERGGWSDDQILWVSAIPSIVGAVVILLAATLSDRSGERKRFVVTGLLVAAVGVIICAVAPNAPLTVVGLCMIQIGGQIANAPFWALATGFLSGAAAAGGIALINSIGNFGSFFGPQIIGNLKEWLGAYQPALFILAGVYVTASFVASRLPPDPAQQPKTPA